MKSIIQINSKVKNNFFYFTNKSFENKGNKHIERLWENKNIGIFDDIKLPIDYKFLNKVKDLDGSKIPKKVKKLKNKNLNDNSLLEYFYNSKSDQKIFKDMILKCNDYILNLIKSLIHYKIVDVNYTWRLSSTIFEELHYDIYENDPECFTFRVFFNLDNYPRLWGISHSMFDLVNLYKNQIDFLQIKDKSLGQIAKYLNKNILINNIERHFISFAPKSMWIGNSLILPHQIIFGRKMIVYSIKCKESSLLFAKATNENYIKSLFPV